MELIDRREHLPAAGRGDADHSGLNRITAARSFAAAEAAHLVELGVAYRDVLAIQRLAVLAVVDVGIVEVDEVPRRSG